MTQHEFDNLQPGDFDPQLARARTGRPCFTVVKKTSAGYSIKYPLPVKRTGRACTPSAWVKVVMQ